MKNSIFKRLFKIISITSIGAVFIAIFFCSFTIKQYFLSVNINDLNKQLSTLSNDFIANNYNLDKIIESTSMKYSAIQVYDISNKEIASKYNYNDFTSEKINKALKPYINTVIKGNSIKGVTKLQGFNDDIILIGQPIRENGKIIGCVFLIKIANQLTSSLKGFYIVLGVSLILVLTSIVIPLYIFIKRIVKPLEQMTKATIEMSKGDFSTRIKPYKKDEIGQLVDAFNSLANKLEENNKQSALLEQTRRDYIANVSHELKTPISSLRAIGEILNDNDILEKIDKKKYYSMILRESMRLEMLIEDMLELSRLQSGNLALEKSYVSIKEIIFEVEDEFKIRADDLDINFNIPENIEELSSVFTNKYRIVQVIVILLDNAFKFTPIQGTVGIEVVEEEKKIKVSVYDTGIGIEDKDKPFVFERFYKADKAHSSIGTGIGLSIAYEIMKHLNEEIYVNSKIGEGSVFTFTLSKS